MASKTTAVKTAMTKTQLIAALSEGTGLAKKDVTAVLDELASIMERHLRKRGSAGTFTLPGLLRVKTVKVPARPAQKGVKNPFTGELMDRPAKPASTKVKVTPLKKLKDMAI